MPLAPQLRPYRPEDLDALYRICLQTGDGGEDATGLYRDPRLIGELYAAPYARYSPELAFVLDVTPAGVSGYVLGVLDTAAFEERLEREWWPQLRQRYPRPDPDGPASPDRRLVEAIHAPDPTARELLGDYPSHLHIDLLPAVQERGYGRLMILTLLGALRGRGSRGVHLGVARRNERAIGFYRHLGFEVLGERPGALTLGMRL